MRTYGQYCPIARASEILAERWTLIIIRNMLSGATTFSEIAAGAPGIPRSLLAGRLRELERVGVVATTPRDRGRGSSYRLTEAGQALTPVIEALGSWGRSWLELGPQHLDPGMVLYSWVHWYLVDTALPETRVVARFEFIGCERGGPNLWVVFERDASEVCRSDPGIPEDVVVRAEPRALALWHLGELPWQEAIASGRIEIVGPSALRAALPTWNARISGTRA